MHRKLTASLSAFIFSLILAFLAFSVSQAVTDIHNQSLGIRGEYTRLSIPQVSDPSPQLKRQQEEGLTKLQQYLAQEKIIFISATAEAEGSPSIITYDPQSTTWAQKVKPSQTYAIEGSYSAQLWEKKQKNPYLPPSIAAINGIIPLDASLQGEPFQFIHGLDGNLPPVGQAVISTKNPEKIQHIQELLSQATLQAQILPRTTWKNELILHKEIDFTLLASLLSIVVCAMALNGVLEELIPEFIIHTYSGGTAFSIACQYSRHQFPTVIISCCAGTAFLLLMNSVLQFARINQFLLCLLLLSGLVSVLIIELLLFLIVFSQLQVIFATTRSR